MSNSYFPRRDGDAVIAMANIARTISAAPWVYMLSPADAQMIQRAADDFQAAYSVAMAESTRTKVSVAAKDIARAAAEQLWQGFYSRIKANDGVSDEDKIAIRVRPLNRNRSPISVPQTSPAISIVGATPHSQTLFYRDSMTPTSRGKPFGAISLQLFVAIGDKPTRDSGEAKFYGSFTKNPVGVGFDSADDGKVATYFGRWTSRRGDVGPWSSPVSMRIAA